MKTERKKFLLTLLIALVLLLAIFFGYAWYLQKAKPEKKTTVAVCGKKNN